MASNQKKSPQQISEKLRQLVREELATIFAAPPSPSGAQKGKAHDNSSGESGSSPSSLAQQEKEILSRLADHLSQLRTVLSEIQTLADQMDQLLQSRGSSGGSS
ncbi:MAG: hypothetical protein QJR00_00660 [Bacillota bacterium]|nr:hypothetical protein [Bacillota bacterium]